jgi:hypothetical protein
MKWIIGAAGTVIGLAACGFSPPPDVRDPDASVTGDVLGMWDGASLTLELAADGLDIPARITVSANEEFFFEPLLEHGDQFMVTVAEAPAEHSCEVRDGSGTIGDGEAHVTVSCTGPTVDIMLSIPADFAFNSEQLAYDVPTSVLAQRIGFTISAPAATDIKVGAVSGWESGQPTIPLPLVIGPNEFRVEVDIDDLSRVYTLNIDRGGESPSEFLFAKATNPGVDDHFGTATLFDLTGHELPGAIAVDGDTLVVGAANEDSNGTSESDDSAEDSGAVYVFRRSGDTWVQEGYLKPAVVGAGDVFGNAVAVSGDTIVVGAPYEDSADDGINGDASDDAAANAGAAYVFRRTSAGWEEEAYLKASNSDAGDQFGGAVAISGNTIVVGAAKEAGTGAAYVYVRSGSVWTQQAYLRASLPKDNQNFGRAVDVHDDTIVVGAPEDDSCYTGVNNNEADTGCTGAGAVYAYFRAGTTWTKKAYIKAFNTGNFDSFGRSVAVHGDFLVVGAPEEDSSNASTPSDNSASNRGGVYVFTRPSESSIWAQIAFLKSSNIGAQLGTDIDVLGDVIVASNASNAIMSFHHDGVQWTEVSVVTSSTSQTGDRFGAGIALGADTLVASAPEEDSLLPGVNASDDGVTSDLGVGAAYAFR